MPTCEVCRTKFYYSTRLDPPEDCDCGRCWARCQDTTHDEIEEMAEARRNWLKREDEHADDGA